MKKLLVTLFLLGSVVTGAAYAASACCNAAPCCQEKAPCCQEKAPCCK